MHEQIRRDSRLATVFATCVCVWALGMAVLSLATAPGDAPALRGEPVAAAAATSP